VIRRGDVYLARIAIESGQGQTERYVVIISRDALNRNSPVVVVVPIVEKGARRRIYPSHMSLRAGEGGISGESVVLGEQVRAISVSKLVRQVGQLAPHRVAEVSATLKIVLDL
jgi:mRNA interferase MazF